MEWKAALRMGVACVLAVLGFAVGAAAQEYPTKPVRLIVPFAPGGGTDIVARLVAKTLSENLGQQVVVENRGGGGTIIGTELVVNSPPDGYTLLLGSTTLAINPALRKKLPYDTLKDLIPVVQLSRQPYILVAHPSAGVTTVRELLAKARANPGSLNVGSPGVGSGGHLALELFKMMSDTDMVHVPYKGNGPALSDLLGGQIQLMFPTILSALPHVKSGALRALAVSTARRSAAVPDVPTIAESGVPGYDASSWNGILVPARTPQAIVDKLNAEIARAVRSPEVREALARDGAEPVGGSAAEFKAFLAQEIEKWRKVIARAGIEPE